MDGEAATTLTNNDNDGIDNSNNFKNDKLHIIKKFQTLFDQ